MGLILLRYGEIALKAGNRRYFIKKLRDNMRDSLKKNGIQGAIESAQGRLYVETDQVAGAMSCLSRVFGVVSLSPAMTIPAELAAMQEAALECARQAGLDPSRSFRVRARRADKSFPLTSPQIEREVGQYIREASGGRVDLSDAADLTIDIEVRPEGTFVYGRIIAGPGGLPLGIGGRAVALISGGIDSPVAAWLMMKRGCSIIPLHFRQSEVETGKALENCQVLANYAYGQEVRPIVLEHEQVFGDTVRKLHRIGEERWICIFCKRTLMLKAAEVARKHKARAIITGESLGQVASQTLANLEIISYGVPKPILRPLIGLDKVEIAALARRIGTFDISTRDSAPCPYLPRSPLTTARVGEFLRVLAALEQTNENPTTKNIESAD